jgi:hypothetical protein
MALIRTSGNSADSFKKWCIIGADYASDNYYAYSLQNAEGVTPSHAGAASTLPFNDSDLITYTVSSHTATVTAKVDCYVYANSQDDTASKYLLEAGQSISATANRLAIFAIEK